MIISMAGVSYLLETSISPLSYGDFPNYILIQLHFLVMLPLMIGLYVIVFYVKNSNVAKVLLREWCDVNLSY
jgi:hypothetical protein